MEVDEGHVRAEGEAPPATSELEGSVTANESKPNGDITAEHAAANNVPQSSVPTAAQPSDPQTAVAPPSKGRSVKTPLQKEALEAAYKVKKFPDEAIRRALGERIQLSEQQVGIWFSHRRRKDRMKVLEEEKQAQLAVSPAPSGQPVVRPTTDAVQSNQATSTNGHLTAGANGNTEPQSDAIANGLKPIQTAAVPLDILNPSPSPAAALPAAKAVLDGQPAQDQVILSDAVKRLLTFVKMHGKQPPLPAAVRDKLPELIANAKSKLEVPFLSNGPPLVAEFDEPPDIKPDGTYADAATTPLKRKHIDGEDDGPARKKRPSAGAKGAARNDAERTDRERKRAEEKAERERKKSELAQEKEEKKLRIAQEREEKKQQLQAAKEARAQQRKDAVNERRKEKEVLKALQAQERQATRLRQRDMGTGPRDDLDLEWEALVKAQQEAGYASGTEEGQESSTGEIVRPEFPPPDLGYLPLFPPELPESLGSNILIAWEFLHSFQNLLGIPYMTFDDLLQALVDGEKSCVLGELHMSMLRVVQADMEEAHATGAMQSGPTINFLDKAIVSCASMLEEAWSWGFDIDTWRAHLNCVTWPEILRQMAILWGLGPKRPKPRREVRPKMGTDGEDLVADESGGLRLRLPPRLGIGTMKAAAWQILAEEGPAGLAIPEIARRIQQSGLRDLRTTKTPEASVAGALSRDVIFARVAPSTYALQAVVSHQNSGTLGVEKQQGQQEKTEPKPQEEKGQGDGEEEEDVESSGDEDDDHAHHHVKEVTGESWVRSLLHKEYRQTTLEERVSILTSLVHLTVDGPTIRNTLEMRQEEAGKVRKKMWEEARSDKKKRQEEAEAIARAKEAAEAARQSVEPNAHAGSPAPQISDISERGQDGGEEAASVRNTPEVSVKADPEPVVKDDNVKDENGDVRMEDVSEKPADTEKQEKKDENGDLRMEDVSGKPANTEKQEKKGENGDLRMEDISGKPADTEKQEKKDEDRSTPAPRDETRRTPGHTERDRSVVPKSEAGGPGRKSEEEAAAIAAAAAAQKERQLLRAETIRRAEEANATRAEPLGLDRRHNKYWRLVDPKHCEGDSFAGRLVIESAQDGSHRLIYTAEGVDGLIAALDKRGLREGPLYNNLVTQKSAITSTMPSSSVRMPDAYKEEAERQLAESLTERTESILCMAERFAGIKRAKRPRTDGEDPGLERCRLSLLSIAQATPAEALKDTWVAHGWQEKVQAASCAADLKEPLEEFEGALQAGWLTPQYVTERALVKCAWSPGLTESPARSAAEAPAAASASAVPISWLPPTTAALLLRIQALDSAIFYHGNAPTGREILTAYRYTMRPVPLAKRPECTEGENGPPEDKPAGDESAEQPKEELEGGKEVRLKFMAGQAVGIGGRALPTLLPTLPSVLGKRKAFVLPSEKLRKEIEDERAGIMPAPMIISRPPLPAAGGKSGRANAKGAAKSKGKGKASKGKGKSSKSALRDEFDRQSEEEEAAERAAFSTPGFSDDDSEGDLIFKRTRDEDLEISD